MVRRPMFLALAIKGLIGTDGQLLMADAQLRRLHSESGGEDGGVLAVPALLDLAMLAQKTGLKIERPVYVADGEHDLELWVEAAPQDSGVSLSILGWQEAGDRLARAPQYAPIVLGERSAETRYDIALSPDGTVVRISDDWLDRLGNAAVGKSVSRSLHLALDAKEGWADLLIHGSNVIDLIVIVPKSGEAFVLFGEAVDASNGGFLGWHCRLSPAQADDGSADDKPADSPAGAVFGRQFASAVRQPLSRIIANAETIGSQLNGPLKDNYAGYAQDIASAARHLAELVSDLEDLDAVERPDFKVARENVELGDMARRVAGLLALKAADHHIQLITPPDGARVNAVGEFRRVLQVLLNLVGNAIRYAPDGSTVQIAIDPEGPSISVSDQGAGVPEQDRERVFEKFERLGRSGDGGSGLGLYISRKLARAMRGELTVTEAPGGGACFTLRLPAA
jgi:hypothetical protein